MKNGIAACKKGYTIIELLIVIFILILIFTLGQANFRSFRQRQKVESAVRRFKSSLQLAKGKALSGQKPAGCGVLKSYTIDRASAYEYNLRSVCDNQLCSNGNIESRVSLSPDTNIRFVGGNFCVEFIPVGRGVSGSHNITISDIQTNISQTVSITVDGVIN